MVGTRKIAAILVADIVGYSRLAGVDEDRTLSRLRGLQSDLIDPAIDALHGRIVERTGGPRLAPARGRPVNGAHFARIARSLLAAGVIGAQIFVVSAAARTFPIPSDQPVATVDIPDSWRPALTPNGVEGSANDGAVRLAVEFVAASDLDAASAAAMKKLAGRGVVVAPETKRLATRRFNGLDALKIDFSGTDPNGESSITLILVAAPRKPGFVSICYWGDDETQVSVSDDLLSIIDSVEATK